MRRRLTCAVPALLVAAQGAVGLSCGPPPSADDTIKANCDGFRNGASASDQFLCMKMEGSQAMCMPPNTGDQRCPGDHVCCSAGTVPAGLQCGAGQVQAEPRPLPQPAQCPRCDDFGSGATERTAYVCARAGSDGRTICMLPDAGACPAGHMCCPGLAKPDQPPIPGLCGVQTVSTTTTACQDFQWPPPGVRFCSTASDCAAGEGCGGCVPSSCSCDSGSGRICTSDCRTTCTRDVNRDLGGFRRRRPASNPGTEIGGAMGGTLEECGRLCQDTSGCSNFAFSQMRRECWLADGCVTDVTAEDSGAAADWSTYIREGGQCGGTRNVVAKLLLRLTAQPDTVERSEGPLLDMVVSLLRPQMPSLDRASLSGTTVRGVLPSWRRAAAAQSQTDYLLWVRDSTGARNQAALQAAVQAGLSTQAAADRMQSEVGFAVQSVAAAGPGSPASSPAARSSAFSVIFTCSSTSAAASACNDGGTYADPLTVSIAGTSGYETRFTTDGSVPTLSSTVYTAPLTLTAGTWVISTAASQGSYLSPTTNTLTVRVLGSGSAAPPSVANLPPTATLQTPVVTVPSGQQSYVQQNAVTGISGPEAGQTVSTRCHSPNMQFATTPVLQITGNVGSLSLTPSAAGAGTVTCELTDNGSPPRSSAVHFTVRVGQVLQTPGVPPTGTGGLGATCLTNTDCATGWCRSVKLTQGCSASKQCIAYQTVGGSCLTTAASCDVMACLPGLSCISSSGVVGTSGVCSTTTVPTVPTVPVPVTPPPVVQNMPPTATVAVPVLEVTALQPFFRAGVLSGVSAPEFGQTVISTCRAQAPALFTAQPNMAVAAGQGSVSLTVAGSGESLVTCTLRDNGVPAMTTTVSFTVRSTAGNPVPGAAPNAPTNRAPDAPLATGRPGAAIIPVCTPGDRRTGRAMRLGTSIPIGSFRREQFGDAVNRVTSQSLRAPFVCIYSICPGSACPSGSCPTSSADKQNRGCILDTRIPARFAAPLQSATYIDFDVVGDASLSTVAKEQQRQAVFNDILADVQRCQSGNSCQMTGMQLTGQPTWIDPPPATPAPGSGSSGLSDGALIGIIAGCGALALLCCLVLAFLLCRGTKKTKKEKRTRDPNSDGYYSPVPAHQTRGIGAASTMQSFGSSSPLHASSPTKEAAELPPQEGRSVSFADPPATEFPSRKVVQEVPSTTVASAMTATMPQSRSAQGTSTSFTETSYDGYSYASASEPAGHEYNVGDTVRALYVDGQWYDATVRDCDDSGRYGVEWYDGTYSDGLPADQLSRA